MYVESVVSHANTLVAWCTNALAASGGMPIDDGNQLLSSGGVLGGDHKVIDLMANKDELTIDLAPIKIALMRGGRKSLQNANYHPLPQGTCLGMTL